MPLLTAGPSRFLGGGNVTWLLRDEFTTDLASGAVNGTAAEPGPGTRVVASDANSTLTIASGLATFATGSPTSYADPSIRYDSIARTPGRLLIARITAAVTDKLSWFGFNDSTTITAGSLANATHAVKFVGGGALELIENNTAVVSAGTYSAGIACNLALILRAAGAFVLINTNSGGWRLLFMHRLDTTTPVYPVALANYSHTSTVDWVRVPDNLWLPTPLVSDGFATTFGTSDGLGHAEGIATGIGAGGGGVTWTGATWSVAVGKAINTPVPGSELLTNGDFSSATGWTSDSGWTIGAGVATKAVSGGTSDVYKSGVATTGTWYRLAWTIASLSAGSFAPIIGGAGYSGATSAGAYIASGRATGSTFAGIRATSATDGVIDNVTFHPLILSELISSVTAATANVVVGVALTVTARLQAGLCLNLDSASTPANFVLAYHDGTNVNLVKCVAGVYTSLIATAATYSAGARLVVTKDGTAYRVYYNNSLVGTEQTIADAGIVSNTLHGLFSTDASNTLDDFVIFARGNEGQYAELDRYSGS